MSFGAYLLNIQYIILSLDKLFDHLATFNRYKLWLNNTTLDYIQNLCYNITMSERALDILALDKAPDAAVTKNIPLFRQGEDALAASLATFVNVAEETARPSERHISFEGFRVSTNQRLAATLISVQNEQSGDQEIAGGISFTNLRDPKNVFCAIKKTLAGPWKNLYGGQELSNNSVINQLRILNPALYFDTTETISNGGMFDLLSGLDGRFSKRQVETSYHYEDPIKNYDSSVLTKVTTAKTNRGTLHSISVASKVNIGEEIVAFEKRFQNIGLGRRDNQLLGEVSIWAIGSSGSTETQPSASNALSNVELKHLMPEVHPADFVSNLEERLGNLNPTGDLRVSSFI